MDKDIAVLRVETDKIAPLDCARDITPGLDVAIWGFTKQTLERFPQGQSLDARITQGRMIWTWPEGIVSEGRRAWNREPAVKVPVYGVKVDSAGEGLSGAPVFEFNRSKIVGMFLAVKGTNPFKDQSTKGWVVPIEAVRGDFDREINGGFSPIGVWKLEIWRTEPRFLLFSLPGFGEVRNPSAPVLSWIIRFHPNHSFSGVARDPTPSIALPVGLFPLSISLEATGPTRQTRLSGRWSYSPVSSKLTLRTKEGIETLIEDIRRDRFSDRIVGKLKSSGSSALTRYSLSAYFGRPSLQETTAGLLGSNLRI